MDSLLPQSNTFGAILLIIFGFGFLIFVHELGHFLVAKWVGIKVEQFAIGFGHSILAWRKGIGFRVGSTEPELRRRIVKYLQEQEELQVDAEGKEPELSEEQIEKAITALGLGETEYRFNWMPLGGYVKMLGQDDMDPSNLSQNPRAFNRKAALPRAAVIAAGVFMNLVFGVLFLVVAFIAGVSFPPSIVGDVMPGMPASSAYAVGHDGDPAYRGLQPGDRITHIDGEVVGDMMDVRIATALARSGQEFEFTVEREGEPSPLKYHMVPQVDPTEKLLSMGIKPNLSLTVAALYEDSKEYEAGVRPGMVVTKVDGQPVENYAEYLGMLTALKGKPVTVEFTDEESGSKVTVEQSAEAGLQFTKSGEEKHLAGFVPAMEVGSVSPDSAAESVGVKVGDVIAEMNTHAWPTFDQVRRIVGEADGGELQVSVLRDGEIVSLQAVRPRNGLFGIGPALDKLYVGQTLDDTPAAELNLPGGSMILTVNGQEVSNWTQLQGILSSLEDGEEKVEIGYQLNLAGNPVEEKTVVFSADSVSELQQAKWYPPFSVVLDREMQLVQTSNPVQAMGLGLEKTGQLMIQTYVIIGRLFQGTVKVEHLRGPVGIVDEGQKIAKKGYTYLLFFLGVISINLVVINFLPLPIVDGGLMVILIIEKIKGSPVSPRVLSMANVVGLVLIGSLALVLTYHDIARIIKDMIG